MIRCLANERACRAIFFSPDRWNLIDSPASSIRHMDDEDLRKTIIEDLILLEGYRRDGYAIPMSWSDLLRFVSNDRRLVDRALDALLHPCTQWFLQRQNDPSSDEVAIDPAKMREAQYFAGTWIDTDYVMFDGPPEDPSTWKPVPAEQSH